MPRHLNGHEDRTPRHAVVPPTDGVRTPAQPNARRFRASTVRALAVRASTVRSSDVSCVAFSRRRRFGAPAIRSTGGPPLWRFSVRAFRRSAPLGVCRPVYTSVDRGGMRQNSRSVSLKETISFAETRDVAFAPCAQRTRRRRQISRPQHPPLLLCPPAPYNATPYNATPYNATTRFCAFALAPCLVRATPTASGESAATCSGRSAWSVPACTA